MSHPIDYTLTMRWLAAILLVLLLSAPSHALIISDDDIEKIQEDISYMPVGDRIALWAEIFIGTPYDPDPLGDYVTRRVIVADYAVDCMYLTFRSVELALSETPEEAIDLALTLRFHDRGIIKRGRVVNYGDRFEYAADMLHSGKWGNDITPILPGSTDMEGSRGISRVTFVPRDDIPSTFGLLQSGDIVYFVKDPSTRVVGEIVGHIGILKREGGTLFLIHASGRKMFGGWVVKVPFDYYVRRMPFTGIMVGRF